MRIRIRDPYGKIFWRPEMQWHYFYMGPVPRWATCLNLLFLLLDTKMGSCDLIYYQLYVIAEIGTQKELLILWICGYFKVGPEWLWNGVKFSLLLERVRSYLWDRDLVATYKETRHQLLLFYLTFSLLFFGVADRWRFDADPRPEPTSLFLLWCRSVLFIPRN
jgi:hypothetical protein